MTKLHRLVGATMLGVSLMALAACTPPATQPSAQAASKQEVSAQTEDVMRRFNQVFQDHDPSALPDLIAQDVVMETMQPAPNGIRYEGYGVNLAFWRALAADRSTRFSQTCCRA